MPFGHSCKPVCSAPEGLKGACGHLDTLSWVVGDAGGGVTIHAASIISVPVSPGAYAHEVQVAIFNPGSGWQNALLNVQTFVYIA